MRFLDSVLLRLRNFLSCASPSAVSSRPTGPGDAALSSIGSGGEDAVYRLSDSILLKILKGDITQWSVDGSSDAIVNPANERMLGGGGADGAIHDAAGPQLRAACYEVPEVSPGVRCPTGEARITQGFHLPASHVIHTVGPIYDSDSNPKESLSNAYKYPFDEAASVAISTVKRFANDLKEVHFVLFSDDTYNVWINKAKEMLQR
ncbi:PREDICTED: uncharacterized protein LOC104803204 isoform X2 [Tarenaya hassleriana]|uniref:uncharacterized protein LOC104803204 isoform X2 n=1 Tax=Tarenaya hassleriana TaxID=28532 RepID=UPI00053C976F|nr:PREDICTED: uncharacterized protein LOC104803204 isoform X2 [Tarenaya hassleriana]